VVPTLQTLKPEDVKGRTAVVIDVLRATSTVVSAMQAGAAEVRPVSSPKEARAHYARLARARVRARTRRPADGTGAEVGDGSGDTPAAGVDDLLLGGERMGLRIEGFHLSNSPLEYTPERVAGKTILFTTTNGTRTMRRAAGRMEPGPARRVLVAAFLNASAVAHRILEEKEGEVVMACAGTRGGFSLEDILLAGYIVDYLQRHSPPEVFRYRDLARAAAALYRSLAGEDGSGLAQAVVTTDHARYLTSLGFGDDVALCASLDLTPVVPEYRRGRITVPER